MAQAVERFGGAPRIARGLDALEGAIIDILHTRDRTFGDGTVGSEDGEHGIVLALASILSKDDSTPPA